MTDILSTEVFAVDLLLPSFISPFEFQQGQITSDIFDVDPTISDDPPVVSGWSPAPGTAIHSRDALHFTVLPVGGAALQRVLVLVSFPGLKLYEVAHDGDAFSTTYPERVGNQRLANGDGYSFTLLRQEGWPASPRLVPVAVDEFGNMNAITDVVYAWTLIE